MISLEYFLIGNNICPSIQIDKKKNTCQKSTEK